MGAESQARCVKAVVLRDPKKQEKRINIKEKSRTLEFIDKRWPGFIGDDLIYTDRVRLS